MGDGMEDRLSDDPGMLWNDPGTGKRLWSLRKHDRELTAELLAWGEYGCELQLLRDRGFHSSKRFDTIERAVTCARRICQNLEAEGWEHT